MLGAPVLTARGALRAGCGLVRLAMPAPLLNAGLAALTSATGVALATDEAGGLVAHEGVAALDALARGSDCLAVGPGLGAGSGPGAAALRAVQQDDCPVVVDADALNALAHVPELWRDFRAAAVLTPHPGEFARLAAALRVRGDATEERERPGAAEALAQRLGCVVVLKGAGTVVSDGHRTWVCGAGHACLATAGTGDVLTGVIAGLIAQHHPRADAARMDATRAMALRALAARGMSPPAGEVAGGAEPRGGSDTPRTLDLFECARLAVLAHARAGEAWARGHGASAGLLAQELADEVPRALETLREA
jgi:NAD(P)H-hydrate epimerase